MATSLSEVLAARLSAPPLTVAPGATTRAAAVLVPLIEGATLLDSEVVFIVRPRAMPTHPGQVAFPGGGLMPGEDPVAGALRETEEELGVARSVPVVVGRLDDLVTHTDFVISPIVAVLPPDVVLVPSPREVDAIMRVPVRRLLDPAGVRTARGRRRIPGPEGRLYFWVAEAHVIWGATGHMLAALLDALR